MGKVYRISCRDAGVDCDFQAQASSLDEIMQLCAEHGMQAHNMKGFGPELYLNCLLYTSPSPRDRTRSRMPSSA